MSRVNLLPTDIKKGQEVRRRTLLVLIGAAAVIGLIIFFWVLQGVRLSGVNDDIEAQNQTNAALQQEITDLQKYEDLQVEAQQQEQLLDGRLRERGGVFMASCVDVSKVIPPDTYLTSFASTVDTTAVALIRSAPTPTFVGTMTFSGATLHFEFAEYLAQPARGRAWMGEPVDVEHLPGEFGRRRVHLRHLRRPDAGRPDGTRLGRSGGGRWVTRARRSSPPPARS